MGSIPIRGIFCFLPPRSPTRRPRGGDVDAPDAPVAARELAGHRGDASGFRGVGTSLVFVSVFFLCRLVFRESARRTSRAVFASVRLEVGPLFVSRRLYAEATGTARSKAGAAKTLEASLYRRRDDERILLVDVGNAFDFLHPRARAGVKNQTRYRRRPKGSFRHRAGGKETPPKSSPRPLSNALFPSLQRKDDATRTVVRPPNERTRKPRETFVAHSPEKLNDKEKKRKRKQGWCPRRENPTRLLDAPRARARRPARRVRRRRRLADASSGSAAAKNKRYL